MSAKELVAWGIAQNLIHPPATPAEPIPDMARKAYDDARRKNFQKRGLTTRGKRRSYNSYPELSLLPESERKTAYMKIWRARLW